MPSLTLPTSPELLKALETPRIPVFGPDGQSDFRETGWTPLKLSAEARRDADRHLDMLTDLSTPVAPDLAAHWLFKLGVLTSSGRMTPQEAAMKLDAYPGMLARKPYPAACFTPETLEKAASTFRFFPTYAELTDFLDQQCRLFDRNLDRVSRLVGQGVD